MMSKHRKSTLRATFKKSLKIKQSTFVGKLSGRYLFRAAVRLVIEYKDWIGDDILSEHIGDDVTTNVKRAQRKKSKLDLSIKDRSTLLILPHKRSKDEIAYINGLLHNVGAFKKFSEDTRLLLAAECFYQFLPAGRTVIRQGHIPFSQYYILKGQLQILKKVTDDLTGEVKEMDIGTLESGDMFGENALLHNIRRTATLVCKTTVDLLLITKGMFFMYLKHILLNEWVILRDTFVSFNYFKGWSEEMMRDCCILSKIVNFKKNEILLGDGKGMVHYVYFILSGECQLIEHMHVEKYQVGKQIRYKLYDPQQVDRNPRQQISRAKKVDFPADSISTLLMEPSSPDKTKANVMEKEVSSPEDYIKLISSKKSNTNVVMDRISVVTVTLQDVINQWHEITDVVEMLMVEPCLTSMRTNLKNVSTVFMQICLFNRGACFGLGEQMKNRRVISITPVKCLLIPRYWLLQHNRANIWVRIKTFLNSKYPNNKELLQKCVEQRMWTKHRREYANKIINQSEKLRNDTKMYHVPYSIRIHEDIINE